VLRRVFALAVLSIGLLAARGAQALDLNKHFLMGVRLGDYLPADEQKGGFRAFGGISEGSERAVKIKEVPSLALTFGYAVAKLGKAQVVVELQVERIDSSMGPETVFRDRDASTRIPLPPGNVISPSGDEEFLRMGIGDITLTPIFVNALFHWSGAGGRADFYAGGGPGVVLADVSESDEFRAFKSDFDGVDDLEVEDAFGVMVKVGSDVALKRDGNLMLYFEAEFISTGFLSSESQVRWSGSEYFASTQDVDTNGDNVDDVFGVPADFRIVDPGKFRVDGATIGLGLRYRFGGRKVSASAPAASEGTPPAQP
jgi:hypothetical protein